MPKAGIHRSCRSQIALSEESTANGGQVVKVFTRSRNRHDRLGRLHEAR
jgi:hypothetical protein